MTVTGAELKATLNGLGLTPAWFADYVGVTMRTVVRWFDADAIADDAAEALAEVAAKTETAIERIETSSQEGADGVVVLPVYRTDPDYQERAARDESWPTAAEWHRILTYRAAQILRDEGVKVRFEYR